MGMFDFLKKKERKKQVISPDDSLGNIAVKLAEADVISAPKDDNHNAFGEDLDHLVNGELPSGWLYAKRNFIEPRDKKVLDLHIRSCKATSILEEKALTEEFLAAFYSYKNECKELGECYIKYFNRMHEKQYTHSDGCLTMAERKEKRLAFINENLDTLLADEELKNSLLKTMPNDVESIIKQNPGIIQSELIKQFDPIIKSEISTLLYNLDKQNKIQRKKQGRSYSLTWL